MKQPREAKPLEDSTLADLRPTDELKAQRAQLGQYLTPSGISAFMARLFPPGFQDVRLLDAGAGKGALTSAFVNRWKDSGRSGSVAADAYEIDNLMLKYLRETAMELSNLEGVQIRVFGADFIEHASEMLKSKENRNYTHAILNPPYNKIKTNSRYRSLLREAGLETVNLYSGFVGLAISLMKKGGEVVAVIPRSFCNGPYYQHFRHFMLARAAIRHIHLFEYRDRAFKEDGVLQENIIIRLTCDEPQTDVTISTSADDTFSDYKETVHPFSSIVPPGQAAQFIHIPVGDDAGLLKGPAFRFRLEELGFSVSTGPVVDFRVKNDLRADPGLGTVPLLYPGHFTSKGMEWPKQGFKKPNAILHTHQTAKWLFPAGFYAVVRRFSSKEERRRIIANVVEPDTLQSEKIGFENHLNVVHDNKRPLDENIARGLVVYLNATVVDQFFRRFNGHTQVNEADLKFMPYPSRSELVELGQWAKKFPQPSQAEIDAKVSEIR
jgi:adenine-specific DNA-methyltransferase